MDIGESDVDNENNLYLNEDLDSYEPDFIDDRLVLSEVSEDDGEEGDDIDADEVVDEGEDVGATDDEQQLLSFSEDEEDLVPSTPKKR